MANGGAEKVPRAPRLIGEITVALSQGRGDDRFPPGRWVAFLFIGIAREEGWVTVDEQSDRNLEGGHGKMTDECPKLRASAKETGISRFETSDKVSVKSIITVFSVMFPGPLLRPGPMGRRIPRRPGRRRVSHPPSSQDVFRPRTPLADELYLVLYPSKDVRVPEYKVTP